MQVRPGLEMLGSGNSLMMRLFHLASNSSLLSSLNLLHKLLKECSL